MINPWTILGVVAVWLMSLAGVGYWQHQDGVTVTEAAYAKRDNIALTTANNALHDLEEKYRAYEKQHGLDLAAIASNYEKGKQDANAKTADLIAAARAGALRLYRHQAAGIPAAGSAAATASAGTGRCDGTGDRGLPAGDSEFLLALGGRANAVRDKLSACQQIVRSDRSSPLPNPPPQARETFVPAPAGEGTNVKSENPR